MKNKPTDKQLDKIIKRWADYWFYKTKSISGMFCDKPVSALHSLRETIKEIMRIKMGSNL